MKLPLVWRSDYDRVARNMNGYYLDICKAQNALDDADVDWMKDHDEIPSCRISMDLYERISALVNGRDEQRLAAEAERDELRLNNEALQRAMRDTGQAEELAALKAELKELHSALDVIEGSYGGPRVIRSGSARGAALRRVKRIASEARETHDEGIRRLHAWWHLTDAVQGAVDTALSNALEAAGLPREDGND